MRVEDIINDGLSLKNNYGFDCGYAVEILDSGKKEDILELIEISNNLRMAMIHFINRVGINGRYFSCSFKSDNSFKLSSVGMLEIEVRVPCDCGFYNDAEGIEKLRLKFSGVNVEYSDLKPSDSVKYNVLKGLLSGIFA